MSEFVRIDFNRPMPLFPLPDTVLLPHAVQPLHIFEDRYCEMVNHSLDSSGQIAMACFEGDQWRFDTPEISGTPGTPENPGTRIPLPLRPIVCVGQIVQHEKLPLGQHNILLHGVCRARIEQIIEPCENYSYRRGHLAPIENSDDDAIPLDEVRDELRRLLRNPRLKRMRASKSVAEWFDREDVTTPALLELIGSVLLHDGELKYQLLSEPSVVVRADLIRNELLHLDEIVRQAEKQDHKSWPKGMSWN
ncbi:MAG: LON peptidase substrate-binding domain-containing protein [Planctomycetota bacterium]|nr:LON peptidase substrate-binding domain-containing protein [Planctomycetota bacterium]